MTAQTPVGPPMGLAGPFPQAAPRAGSLRGLLWVGLLAMIALLGGFGGWAMTSQLAGAIVVSGRIAVTQTRQALQHPEGGVVAALLVAEGDRVAAGDVVVRLAPGTLAGDRAVAAARLFELRLRRARLEAERDDAAALVFAQDLTDAAAQDAGLADFLNGQAALFAARRATAQREIDQMQARIAQIAAQIDALHAQHAALSEQLALVDGDLTRQRDLHERGLIAADPVLRLHRDAVQLRGALGELAARKAEARERIIETELALLQRATNRREHAIAELREIRIMEEELHHRLADLDRRMDALALRSPVAGRIIGLAVSGPQAVLGPGDPLGFVVPEGLPLVITTEVPAIHIDQVFVGQPVSLRFPAHDLRHLPDLMGRVTQVSADAFVDEPTRAAVYRVEVALDADTQARLAPRALVPGMPVDAFIRTGDRTPMRYLLEPLANYFTRAFRES